MKKIILCVLLLYFVIERVNSQQKQYSKEMISEKYKNPFAVAKNTEMGMKGWISIESTVITYYNASSEYKYYNSSHNYTMTNSTSSISVRSMNDHVLAIKVAAIFRNNLIRVLGYILHRPNMELNSELYTSLYFILSTIKLNQINVLSIIPCLKAVAFKTSNEIFIKIFEEMEKHLPVYLSCAATFWKDAIQNNEVNLNNILKPDKDGPLKVNIFNGLNDEILEKVAKEEKIEAPKNENEIKVLYDFNMNIVQVMRYIQSNKNDIHQLFFGALVLFFPRNVIQPDLEESIQILIEFLQQVEVKQWKKYIGQLNPKQSENPYFVVKEILNNLILDTGIPIVIKESLQIILCNLADRNPTAINPHYNSFASLVELDKINSQYILNYISNGAYSTEIFLAAQRLIIYQRKGYIKHITLFNNFIPYLYSSVPEVFIAILDRVIKRQPDLPAEIIDSSGAVCGYLVFTYRYIVFPVTLPDDMKNLNLMFLGIRSIDIDVNFLKNLNTILTLLQKQDLDYLKILTEIPIHTCATPIVCFMQFILKLKTMTVVNPEVNVIIDLILNTDCFCGKCKIDLWVPKNNSLIPEDILEPILNKTSDDSLTTTLSSSTLPVSISTTPTTTIPTTTVLTTLTQPTEGPVSPPTTLKSTSAAPPTTVTVPDIPVNVTKLPDKKHPEKAIISVVHEIAAGQDLIWVKQIIAVMEKAEFEAKIMKMTLSKKTIIITSIIALLEMVEAKSTAEAEATISQFLETFLMKVKHIEEILKLITTEKQPTRPVLARLIVAVPAPMDNETEMFQQLELLLQKEELFTLIVNHLQKESYKNIGSLLKAVLHEEIKLKEKLSVKEIEAATYYVSKVQLLGFGQGKILWGVDVDVISQNIKIDAIMDNAIGFNALKTENRKQFNCIVRYLREHPPILQTWDKWIYYTKCGDFTKALFHLLAVQANTPSEVKLALNFLTPLINYDGNGEKATFGDEQ